MAGFSPFPSSVNYVAVVAYAARSIDPAVLRSRLYERIWYTLARAGVPLGATISDVPAAHAIPQTLISDSEAGQLVARAGVVHFADLSEETRRALFESAKTLKFARGERFVLTEPCIVANGSVVATFVGGASSADMGLPRLWPRDQLEPVIEEYTQVIGPAGRQLVMQVAPQAPNLRSLYGRLAGLIPGRCCSRKFSFDASR